ncbi:hypothetical protein AC1031_013465 [Aphanomyces cochlioides]|nr:hypothetical protein AC1031_013465 [Aphanomyces cochlioides]
MEARASWSDEKDITWMRELIHQVHVLGKRSDSGYKREAWLAAVSKLNGEHNLNYNRDQVKARHNELKKQYSQVSQMLKTSGIGFEATTCRFVCTEGSWSHFLQDKPKKWSVWQTKRFPLYPYCQQLFDGTLATGEFAASSTTTVAYNPHARGSNEVSDLDSNEDNDETTPPERDDECGQMDMDRDNHDQSKRRRSAAPLGSGISKRVRTSLASVMMAEMKAFRESGRDELQTLHDTLTKCTKQDSEQTSQLASSNSAQAIDVLHDEFSAVLLDEDMSFAYDVFKDEIKAMQFVRMKGNAREIWLRRHIDQKKREHLRVSSD